MTSRKAVPEHSAFLSFADKQFRVLLLLFIKFASKNAQGCLLDVNRPRILFPELEALVDTFIICWDINDAVTSKLMKCSPEVQWKFIASKPPRKVYSLKGVGMRRIAEANIIFCDQPQFSGP